MKNITSPFTSSLKSIKSQFISKEKLIKSSLNNQKKNIDDKAKNTEREKFINYENKIEKVLGFLGKPIKSIGKKFGFLGSLKKFILNLLLGFIAINLLKYLPQLLNTLNMLFKVSNFILDMSGKLLNGLINFVDKGYQAADNAKKLLGSIGGQKAIEALDSMNNQANSLFNSIMIAGMLFSDFGGVGLGSGVANQAVNVASDLVEGEIINQTKKEALKKVTTLAMKPLAAVGIVLGTGLLLSAIGEGLFQIKKLGNSLRGWIDGKLTETSQDKNPITKFLKQKFFGWMQMTLGPAIFLLNGIGVMFDVIGAPFRYGIELIRAAFMKLNDDKKGLDNQNKNLGKFDARVRDGIREHFSILAPLFGFIGMKGFSDKLQTPGSLGSAYGEKAAKDMGYYRGGIVKKFAGGGYAKSGDENKKAKIPRSVKEKNTSLSPGSAVGGTDIIEKIFPYEKDVKKMNSYDYIKSSYQNLSSAGSLGPLMGLTVKSIFGGNIIDTDYDNASNSLSLFLMSGLAEKNPSAYNKIDSTLGTDNLKSIINVEVVKILDDIFSQITNQLKKQLGLLPIPLESGPSGGNGDDCPCPEGSDGEFVATGNIFERALLETISQVEGTAGPDGYRTMFGMGKFQAPPWKHPDSVVRSGGLSSAAAGKYQFMPDTWAMCVKALDLSDFSPANQDKAALWLVKKRGVNPSKQVTLSDMEKLGKEWAGLTPHYGQTDRTAKTSLIIYNEKLKKLGATSSTPISPSSPAGSVDPCICDPDVPSGDPGDVKAAGATAGGNISGYPVTSAFGMRYSPITGKYQKHGGVDISAPPGKPIGLTVDAIAGPPPQFEGGYGNFIDIIIPSLGNLYFRMAHFINPPNYKPGQKIPAGKIIANVGSTGASTGPHVHFEVNKALSGYGGDRDPMPYGKYLTIGRESGGATFSGGIRQLHKGEYVIDKDSVDLFGGNSFFKMINGVENKKQRSEKSSQLIQHLSKYTGRKIDQRPEMIVSSDPIIIQGPPTYITSKSYGGSSGGSSFNYEQDMLELRA